uniref:RISC-loading complex subunit tarbp2-like n=1 Tax=Phallusia mammillata TaxID=59560 RepID=A0A6F9DVB1_9ASCI|nr:RISC-loading complex subunit tarbp2-like [Phallusia mammillata]
MSPVSTLSVTPKSEPSRDFKTPISVLQEYCQKLGKTPRYDLTALEGRAHQPQFVYRCMVGDVTATGQGGSKKQAKHAAAEAVFKALTAGLLPDETNQVDDNQNNLHVVRHVAKESDENNPVGALQETVVARGWRLPEYTLAHETGPAHKKEFIICCTVESFKEYGSGSAKKHAKRIAASNMYNKILNLPPEAKDNVTNQSREAKSKVALHELANSLGERLVLSEVAVNSNHKPCELLDSLAKDHNFEVIYKDIDCKTIKGQQQCIIELTTQPLSVVHGCGDSLWEAYSSAASSALYFIKLFTVNSNGSV